MIISPPNRLKAARRPRLYNTSDSIYSRAFFPQGRDGRQKYKLEDVSTMSLSGNRGEERLSPSCFEALEASPMLYIRKHLPLSGLF